jgi:hypothetical protein
MGGVRPATSHTTFGFRSQPSLPHRLLTKGDNAMTSSAELHAAGRPSPGTELNELFILGRITEDTEGYFITGFSEGSFETCTTAPELPPGCGHAT